MLSCNPCHRLQLVAAFRATLEEISSASVVLHVLDASAPAAPAQCAAVLQVQLNAVALLLGPTNEFSQLFPHARTYSVQICMHALSLCGQNSQRMFTSSCGIFMCYSATANKLTNLPHQPSSTQVLEEIGATGLPLLTAWNKVDAAPHPAALRTLAGRRLDTVAISGATGACACRLRAGHPDTGAVKRHTSYLPLLSVSTICQHYLSPFCCR